VHLRLPVRTELCLAAVLHAGCLVEHAAGSCVGSVVLLLLSLLLLLLLLSLMLLPAPV
jgi:hypothetical protein